MVKKKLLGKPSPKKVLCFKCMFSKDGICISDYNKGVECNGKLPDCCYDFEKVKLSEVLKTLDDETIREEVLEDDFIKGMIEPDPENEGLAKVNRAYVKRILDLHSKKLKERIGE